MFLRSILIVAILAATVAALDAQGYRRPTDRRHSGSQGSQPGDLSGNQPNQPMHIQGIVQNLGTSGLIVADREKNQQWRVVVPTAAVVHVTGTADVASLRAGLYVELEAKVERGVITGKVEQITLTTSSSHNPPGIFSADGKKPNEANRRDDKKHKPGGEKEEAAPAHGGGDSRVVGRLTAVRNGQCTIQVGRKKIRFELSDEAAVKVDMSDWSMVRTGDEISVQGIAVQARQGVVVQAQKVDVKICEAPTDDGAEKKPGRKSPPDGPHRAKKGAPPSSPDDERP